MRKILYKRVFRELKAGLFRYLALGFLILLGMYLVVSIVGAAETVIAGVDKKALANKLEDGQFSVFNPLSLQEERLLSEEGIALERMFYLDFVVEDGSTLRVFENREHINLVDLDEGRVPERNREAILEKRYCEEHGIVMGDRIYIGGESLQVVGIGSVPDYDAMFKSLADSSADSERFGLLFVTGDTYARLADSGKSLRTEEYVYAYRLNGAMTHEELKDILKNNMMMPEEVEDPYFQEYWERTAGKKKKLEDGMEALVEGAEKQALGSGALAESMGELALGSGALAESMGELALGSGALAESMGELALGSGALAESAGELAEGMRELRDSAEVLMDTFPEGEISSLIQLIRAQDNPRIKASSEDQLINKTAGLIAGGIVMILFTYVISVFVVHGIEKDSCVTGALYALGVHRRELLAHYLTLPVLVTLLAGTVGTFLGFSRWGIDRQIQDCYHYFSVPQFDTAYPIYLIIYGIVMPPVTAAAVNYLVIRKRLSQPALKLLRNEQGNGKVSNIDLKGMGFVTRFRIRQMMREARSSIAVLGGLFLALLVMMMGIDCYVMCKHLSMETKEDIKFTYMYTLKYPPEAMPQNAESCFAKTMKKEILGKELEVTLLGIDRNNPYFEAAVGRKKNEVVISSAMAQKYGLEAGDRLILSDEEDGIDYAFRIGDIVQYATGLYAFMEIDSMRGLFGEDDSYYNILLTDRELLLPSGRLYNVVSREDIVKSAEVFITLMMPLVTMLTGVSALILGVVMYLMMKVMIDRCTIHISLLRIFGYRNREIGRLYLNGNFYLIAVGAAACIPLAKKIIDGIYPVLVSNVACGMNLAFSRKLYLMIYAMILGLYLVINCLLARRLQKITPGEMLRNRE